MANAKPKYFLVEATALPEVFVKVTEAKSLLETGEARTVAEAVERVDLSRSAFYKYKDCITPFRDMKRDAIMTFHIKLHDKPGTFYLYRIRRKYTHDKPVDTGKRSRARHHIHRAGKPHHQQR